MKFDEPKDEELEAAAWKVLEANAITNLIYDSKKGKNRSWREAAKMAGMAETTFRRRFKQIMATSAYWALYEPDYLRYFVKEIRNKKEPLPIMKWADESAATKKKS